MAPCLQEAAQQLALEQMLLAYAAVDPEVGYCQGLNFVAGCILLYCGDKGLAFATLHLLLVHLGMRELYLPQLAHAQVRACMSLART